MISKHSAHLTPLPFGIRTWLWRYTCLLLLISMLWHRQAIFESKGDKLSSSAESRIRTHQGLRHQIASRLNARWKTDWAIEDQAKKFELDSPSLWSASIQPTWPHCHLAFAPNPNGHKPKRPQTGTTTNRNRHNYIWFSGLQICVLNRSFILVSRSRQK